MNLENHTEVTLVTERERERERERLGGEGREQEKMNLENDTEVTLVNNQICATRE